MKKDDNYYKSLDKRTKEYKNWAKFNRVEHQPKGLGTDIEKVFKATGIKKVVDKLFDDCGCQDRIDKLNDPNLNLKRKPQRCLTETQYNKYNQYRNTRTLNVWQPNEIELLIEIYAHVFAIKYNSKDFCRNCSGSGRTLLRMSKELDKVFESYEG